LPLSLAESTTAASGLKQPQQHTSSAAATMWASLLPPTLKQHEQDDAAGPAASLGMATLLAGLLLAQVYIGTDSIIGTAAPEAPATHECTGVQHIHDPACYSHLQQRRI
jgi:hypothetical protein